MKKYHIGLLLSCFLLLQTSYEGIQAQNQAEELVDTYINLIGGQKALDKIDKLSYSFEMNHLDEGKITVNKITQKRPDTERYEYSASKRIIVYKDSKMNIGNTEDEGKTYIWTERPAPGGDHYILKRFGSFLDYREWI